MADAVNFETDKIRINRYNICEYVNLEYDLIHKVLYYKNHEIPWKSNKATIKNKKTTELKTYTYTSAVVPDMFGKKHKIFKNKFCKFIAESPSYILLSEGFVSLRDENDNYDDDAYGGSTPSGANTNNNVNDDTNNNINDDTNDNINDV
jgi:hypothetical protein